MKIAGLALGVVGAAGLVVSGNGFLCTYQDTTDPDDWKTEECDTFCLIVYGESTLYPEFVQGEKICTGGGCAVLNADGSVNFGASGINDDYPSKGDLEVFRCNNETNVAVVNIHLEQASPCNKFVNYEEAICATMPSDLKVCGDSDNVSACPKLDPSFWALNRVPILISVSVVGSVGILLAIYFFKFRPSSDETAVVGSSKFEGGSVEEDPESWSASPSRADSFASLNPDDEEMLIEMIPAKYKPGSAAYEHFSAQLTAIYEKADMDTSKVDNVLIKYLAKDDGIQQLNKKLKHAFGRTLRPLKVEATSTQAFDF